MTFKTISRAAAAATIISLGATSAFALECTISMPDPQGSAAVASANAALRTVLAENYGITAQAPTGGQTVSVQVSNCNPSDFANTGASMAETGGTLPNGAGALSNGAIAGGLIGAAVLIGVVASDDSSATTTTIDD